MANVKIFRMTSFSPIGFKSINYPVPHCPLCRGYLREPCNVCMENKSDKCNVVVRDGVHYHEHCHTFMNAAPDKKAPNKKAPIESDESE